MPIPSARITKFDCFACGQPVATTATAGSFTVCSGCGVRQLVPGIIAARRPPTQPAPPEARARPSPPPPPARPALTQQPEVTRLTPMPPTGSARGSFQRRALLAAGIPALAVVIYTVVAFRPEGDDHSNRETAKFEVSPKPATRIASVQPRAIEPRPKGIEPRLAPTTPNTPLPITTGAPLNPNPARRLDPAPSRSPEADTGLRSSMSADIPERMPEPVREAGPDVRSLTTADIPNRVLESIRTTSPASFRYPRTQAEIRTTLTTILERPGRALPGLEGERDLALRRLKAYRYLAGLPYRDLALDDRLNDLSTAAADICQRLGHLTHDPENPGLSVDEFKKAHLGAGHSNLGWRSPHATIPLALESWMEDSDDSNISCVGHRRWCLNPSLGNVGLGRAGEYSAMWTTEVVQPPYDDFAFVAFPGPGYVPDDLFHPRYAWSLGLNPRDFRIPDRDNVEVRVYHLEGSEPDRDRPLKLDYFTVNTISIGTPTCLIFRPRTLKVIPGRRYWIEVKGLERPSGGPVPLNYLVEFMSRK